MVLAVAPAAPPAKKLLNINQDESLSFFFSGCLEAGEEGNDEGFIFGKLVFGVDKEEEEKDTSEEEDE